MQQPPARPLADPATAPPEAPCRWRRPHCWPRVASSDVNRLPITASESSALTTFRRLIYWRLLRGHPTGESTAAVPVVFFKKSAAGRGYVRPKNQTNHVQIMRPRERTAGNTSTCWRQRGATTILTRWYGLGDEESPAPPSLGVITCRRDRALKTA